MAYLKLRNAGNLPTRSMAKGDPCSFVAPRASMGSAGKPARFPNFPATTVIIFDYRGTARSSKTVMKYSTAMFAADAAAILDELGAEQAIVCGHSNGGRVVQTLALRLPAKGEQAHPGLERIVVLGDQRHSVEALSGHD